MVKYHTFMFLLFPQMDILVYEVYKYLLYGNWTSQSAHYCKGKT